VHTHRVHLLLFYLLDGSGGGVIRNTGGMTILTSIGADAMKPEARRLSRATRM